jgi:sodium pump decarboxylase gamma subunit
MLLFGLKVSLIGMGIVFFALVLLVFIIRAFSIGAAMLERRSSTVPAVDPTAQVMQIQQAKKGDEEEQAVVISAAVAAYLK